MKLPDFIYTEWFKKLITSFLIIKILEAFLMTINMAQIIFYY